MSGRQTLVNFVSYLIHRLESDDTEQLRVDLEDLLSGLEAELDRAGADPLLRVIGAWAAYQRPERLSDN